MISSTRRSQPVSVAASRVDYAAWLRGCDLGGDIYISPDPAGAYLASGQSDSPPLPPRQGDCDRNIEGASAPAGRATPRWLPQRRTVPQEGDAHEDAGNTTRKAGSTLA